MTSCKHAFFITGTDTDCGKTQVSAALIRYLQQKSRRVAGVKPIASGFQLRDGEWRNADIDALNSASNTALPSKQINRYAYRAAIAPHIAAQQANEVIDIGLIARDIEQASENVDVLVVEGVGGWLVPLSVDSLGSNATESIETLAQRLKLPVILVVGLRLGCLNHALLSARAIMQTDLPFAGWVANHLDPDFEHAQDNIETLVQQMPVPKLFELPYLDNQAESGQINRVDARWLALMEQGFG